MKITDFLSLDSIELNAKAKDKTDVLTKAIDLMSKTGVIKDKKVYTTGIFNREKESTTGVGEGVAIPHCKSATVIKPRLVAMVLPDGVEFQSLDGQPVKVLFMIAAPNSKDNVHLDVLATLSNLLMQPAFIDSLLKAKTKKEFLDVIDKAEIQKEQQQIVATASTVSYPQLVAATACPTGIAHTYMAKEALEKACKAKNITIKVETNGSGGQKNKLTPEEIEHAEAVIVAADSYVEMDRFDGKHLIETGTSQALKSANKLVDSAINKKCPVYHVKGGNKKEQSFDGVKQSKFQTFYRHLMSGIGHMIPFIVAGGILLAIAYIIDGIAGVAPDAMEGGKLIFGNKTIGAKIFHMLGGDIGLGLMLPVLGGFIAYSISGRPGLVSGFIGSFAATKGQFNLMYFILLGTGKMTDWQDLLSNSSAGFIGAIIAGFAAGYLTLQMKDKWFNKMPRTAEGIRDMLIIPLLSSLIIGLGMLCVNVPLSFLNIGVEKGLMALNNLKLTLLLGALVAGLMAIDMGGPINKATHYAVLAIMTSALSKPEMFTVAKQLMAANIVGIMTPPVGIAIATWLFPQKFSKEDRKPSLANIVTGCCGITEGAIPYVMKDPIRVVSSTVLGAAVGGLVAVLWGAEAIAPEGGTISMLSMGAVCYKGIICMILGSFVTAFILGFLKKDVPIEQSLLGGWRGIPIGLKDAANKIHSLEVKLANHKPEVNQLLLDECVERNKALVRDIDEKLADKKEKSSPEKFEKAVKKAEVKKIKLAQDLDKQKKKLQLAADKRKETYDAQEFKKFEATIRIKQAKIEEKEKLRLARLAAKAAKKEAKAL